MGPEAGVGGSPHGHPASLAAGIQEKKLPPRCPPGELATPQHPHSACHAPCARPGAGLRGGRWQVPPQAVALCLLESLSSGWRSSLSSLALSSPSGIPFSLSHKNLSTYRVPGPDKLLSRLTWALAPGDGSQVEAPTHTQMAVLSWACPRRTSQNPSLTWDGDAT